jgi:Cu+-exporting ATPase
MKKSLLLILATVLALAAVAVASAALRPADPALVELAVGRLTCVACAQKIEAALADVDGIGKVAVDVKAGRARVEYDPERTDPATVAGLVTRSGYPAALRRVLAPAEYKVLREGAPGAAVSTSGSGCGGNCCNKP